MFDFEAILAAGIGILLFVLFLIIGLVVLYVIGLWHVFKKAGQPGWKAIIPLYNTWVLVEIVGLNWYWFLISIASEIGSLLGLGGILGLLLTLVSLIGNICIWYNLAKKMHKDVGYVVLLTLFSVIVVPILGLGKSTWDDSVEVDKDGVFGNLFNNNSTSQGTSGQDNISRINEATDSNVDNSTATNDEEK